MQFPVDPMKAVLGALPADDDGWAFELKWDGYRTVVHVRGGKLRAQSSSGADVTARYPELAALPGDLNASSAVLDGELVVLDEEGRPRFELMQRHESQAVFNAFDVLEIDGRETIDLPYERRRALLADVLDAGPNWGVPGHRIGDGRDLLEATAARGLEGVMAKRLGSVYVLGKRSPNWRKVKNRIGTDVVIGGFSAGTGNRVGSFGALLVGVREPDGRLRFAGGVGSGFTQKVLDTLTKQLRALRTEECPFDPPPPRPIVRTATWVRPELVASIEMTEFTNDGLVRQASFLGLVGDQPQSTSAPGTSRRTK
jgi:bifunctional non-homologous end joining protein LigD